MKKLLIIPSLAIALLSGCGGEEVSMATAEEQRAIARDNSMLVAKKFISENPTYNAFKVIPNGDSTISRKCPQGDGWASLKLINEKNHIVKIKCSTYSIGIGCLESSEFAKKSYAQQDGSCNKEIAYPLPKIAG
ncbi:MAG: hypothetical protein KZQ83_14770 [gamma proteobacterium symbiont of Taylorina sp.]|nr:hypothetical protein [gamma proteobacterium symbiont of Taylorina sp.]